MNTLNLPVLMQDAITALEQLHNAPIEMSLQVVLGVINLACQAKYNVDSEVYGIRPISLNLISIAPTGASKTTLYNELMVGINKHVENERINFRQKKEMKECEIAIYEKEKKAYINRTNNDEVTTSLNKKAQTNTFLKNLKLNIMQPNVPPLEPFPLETYDYVTSKGTVNGLIDILKTQPMVGLFSSEAGEFFNGHAFQSKSNDISRAIEMSSILTSMWDGNTIDKCTGMEKLKLYNRRVCMLFLIQESAIKDFLNTTAFSDQGFIHRLLITHTDTFTKPEIIISDELKSTTNKIRNKLQNFHDRIYDLINNPFNIKPETGFELELPIIKMSNDANILLAEYYNAYRNVKMFELEKWDGFAQRIHEMTLRIAANLAIFENNSEITEKNMIAAIELFDFYIEQRKTLTLSITPKNSSNVEDAEKVTDWIIKKKFNGTLRDLQRLGPHGYRKCDKKQRKEIIEEMQSSDKLEFYDLKGITYVKEKV